MEILNAANTLLEQGNHIPQLLSIKAVASYTSISCFIIYKMINEDSDYYDPTFPKKVQLTAVRVVQVASEIADWINAKIGARSA